jgi:hypothetical protein
MDAIYQIQFPIFHAKIMIIGLYTFFYIYAIWIVGIIERNLGGIRIISFIVPLNFIVLYYAYFMLKGVSIKMIYLTKKKKTLNFFNNNRFLSIR